jgi:hypothetical protein
MCIDAENVVKYKIERHLFSELNTIQKKLRRPLTKSCFIALQLIVMKKPCPRNEQELRKAYSSSVITQLNHDNEDLYDYLTIHTGQNVTNVTAVEFLYNTLEIEASSRYILKSCRSVGLSVTFAAVLLLSDTGASLTSIN